ncbi:MAG: CARDB domain-containing protein [Emticicia sp.]|uniref:CARDB domain-containing protein n=1 Tax=Emticicia sp. TaxID=1930953 RepID=UPI003BA83D6C
MKTGLKHLFASIAILYSSQSCSLFDKKCKEADLVVENASFISATKTLRFTVKNIGGATAKNFLVYAEGEGTNSNLNPVCQVSHNVNEILPGGNLQLESVFNDSQCPAVRGGFSSVTRFKITADSKVQVIECSEENNSLTISR